ncbi:hypothetical protein YTPLAS72_36520 [Nitrospira sp.]|nr:hypothetical protein YTPLAS72_36520 [Nitrospira sp.]
MMLCSGETFPQCSTKGRLVIDQENANLHEAMLLLLDEKLLGSFGSLPPGRLYFLEHRDPIA